MGTGAKVGFETKKMKCRREEIRKEIPEAPGEKGRGGGKPQCDLEG